MSRHTNSIHDLINELHQTSLQFGEAYCARKIELLNTILELKIVNRKDIIRYHDTLLSLMAWPENEELFRLVLQAMNRLAKWSKKNSTKLDGTGIAGTKITGRFSYAITKWLVDELNENIMLHSSEAEAESAKLFFRQLMPAVEYESISEKELNLVQRINRLKGKSTSTSLKWLIELIESKQLPSPTKEFLFNELEIFVTLKLKQDFYSRSFARFANRNISFCSDLNKPFESGKILKKPLPPVLRLSLKEKTKLVAIARATLVFLYRETDPFTYANPKEIVLFELEDGISIALYSMDREHRLSIESYVGYLVLKNGIPVAYGGGWIFGERCQFGINILEPFRSGESGYIFSQLLRTYHQHFGVKRFVVKPYQFGKNNKEALQSGAFWFYYKFGFRPEDKHVKKLAQKEWNEKKTNRGYRSTEDILKKLTASNLFLNLSAYPVPLFDASEASNAITNFINDKYDADRKAALRECSEQTMDDLFIKKFSGWNQYEKQAWKQWCLLTQAALTVNRWDNTSRKQLVSLIKAKGGGNEMDFIKKLQKHQQLWNDLQKKLSEKS